MSPPKRIQLGRHYLDAGPLFCLGGSKVLAELFDAHHLSNSKVAAAVVGEVVRNATLILPPVGPHPKRNLRQAAKNARGRYKVLLASATPTPAPEPPLLSAIKADLTTSAKTKLKAGETLHPNANDGEAESVYSAVIESVAVVTNDADAHTVAGKHQVVASTFVEVARHMARVQKGVSRRTIFNELMTLSNRSIFPGEHITSELDLA